MTKEVKNFKFKTEGELREFLQTKLSAVNADGEYNIFLHKVYDFNEDGKNYKGMCSRTNLDGILQYGLRLSKYSSIMQTSVYKGPLQDKTVDDVLSYDYPWPTTEHIVVILALPKNIKLNGKRVNYSTPLFRFAEYGLSRSDNTKSQYTMPFDALKFYEVQTPYILGAIVTHGPSETAEQFEQKGKTYEMFLNMGHMSQMTKAEKKEFLSPVVVKMVTSFNLNKEDDEPTIAAKIYRGIRDLDSKNYRDGSYLSDFDFD